MQIGSPKRAPQDRFYYGHLNYVGVDSKQCFLNLKSDTKQLVVS